MNLPRDGDAPALRRVMDHFVMLRETIAEEDGALVNTIGDAVMAVFRRRASALRAILEAQRRLAAPSGAPPLYLKASHRSSRLASAAGIMMLTSAPTGQEGRDVGLRSAYRHLETPILGKHKRRRGSGQLPAR